MNYCSEVFGETVHQLFINLKKTCDSVKREGLYNILTVSSNRETTKNFERLSALLYFGRKLKEREWLRGFL
jgi:hypothetical protein